MQSSKNWYFSEEAVSLWSWNLFRPLGTWSTWSAQVLEKQIRLSSKYTKQKTSRHSLSIDWINLLHIAGALAKPKGMTWYWKKPQGVQKVVSNWLLFCYLQSIESSFQINFCNFFKTNCSQSINWVTILLLVLAGCPSQLPYRVLDNWHKTYSFYQEPSQNKNRCSSGEFWWDNVTFLELHIEVWT